ncbi:hypothetical protein CH259_11900 [Rhodococcus sp. 05-2254-4]|nr:hypothetical protein CH259_11900 [Rhodococcus sp. 05-2254-4]OZE40680.1 hypothetical protein CH261_26865 [Rhodococcus sp. 05-2254-3]OZE45671.1 hypothetical protein CH283_25520 [Rhodococcus sp. 05-2254-2]
MFLANSFSSTIPPTESCCKEHHRSRTCNLPRFVPDRTPLQTGSLHSTTYDYNLSADTLGRNRRDVTPGRVQCHGP